MQKIGNVYTNLFDEVSKQNINLEEVSTYYDGTPMTDTKVDGRLYMKNVSDSKYYRQVLPNWGENFLNVDTMADLRALDDYNLLLVKSGYYKGVTLLGYYDDSKYDTPLNYLWNNTQGVDDGGSVINVGGGSFTTIFENKVVVDYFGVKNDGSDNSLFYDKMIKALPKNTTIEFSSKGVYKGYFKSNKQFDIKTNGATFINIPTSELNGRNLEYRGIFNFYSERKEMETLNYFPIYGQNYIDVANGTIYNIGDLLILKDEAVRYSDSLADINNELQEVKEIIGNRVYFNDIIRSTYVYSKTSVLKILNPFKEIVFDNLNIECYEQGNNFPIYIQGCHKVVINNISGKGSSSSIINIRDSNDVSASNLTFKDATDRYIGGNGYGIALRNCRNVSINNITSNKVRHSIDLASTYNVDINNCKFFDSIYSEIVMAHNSYGGNITINNITQTGGVSSVSFSNQGIGSIISDVNTVKHFARDIYINNLKHFRTVDDYNSSRDVSQYNSAICETITIEHSIENVNISNIKVYFDGNLSNIGSIDRLSPIKIVGAIGYGNSISNVYTNISYTTISLSGLTQSNVLALQPLLPQSYPFNISNITSENVSQSVISLGLAKEVNIKNIIKKNGVGSSVVRTLTVSDYLPTSKLTIDNVSSNTATDLSLRIDKPSIFIGLDGYFKKTGIRTRQPSSVDFALSSADITYREVYLNYMFDINTTAKSVDFLPTPNIVGEEILFNISDTSVNKNSLKKLIIPNTNINILGESELYVDNVYVFKAVRVSNSLKWYIYKLNSEDKSTTSKDGLVKQSTPIANATSADATDLETALVLINELKVKLNAKLAADRASGQQAT